MSDRKTRISELSLRIASELNDHKTQRGDLSTLSTTSKSNLVAALNELKSLIDNIVLSNVINDGATSSATSTWSINKIKSELQTTVDNLVAGAPGALDTFSELAAALQGNDGDIASLLTSLSKRVRVDAAQSFTEAEMTQGRANIDAASATEMGDPNHDFVSDFENALT